MSTNNFKHIFILFLILIFFQIQPVNAQNSTIDSLNTELKQSKIDTLKIDLLLQISKNTEDPMQILLYFMPNKV